ncbi:MAG: hypothetical protein K0Q59_6096, partial [Paenibacillus sp.]|nr:hypothetical protein [Paenibacillus sp.]
AQTVESFEKMADAPLYHVHTEIGDVWINPEDSEPTDWVEPDYAIELKGRHELYRFPKTSFSIQGAFLEGRTVQPQGYWQDAYGTGWYLLETSVGKVWFTLKPAQDRIIPKDGSPSAHVAYKQTIIDTVQVKESELMAGRTPIGYLAEDLPYLSLDYVTQRFGYALETGSQSLISIRSTEPASEYSLQINPANGEVTTYWADQAAERLTLQHMLKSEDGRYWIAGEDAERLLGLSIDWWSNDRDTFYLFSDEYEVELTPLPSSTRQPALPYLVNRFERPVGPNDAKPREPLRIGLANLAASAPSASEWSYSESRSNEFLPKVSWVRQNGSIPIATSSD